MSNIRLINQIFLFDDLTFSNDSTLSRINYKIDKTENLSVDFRQDRVFPATTTTSLGLTGGPFTWFYLNCDQTVSVRFDTNTDDTVVVSPSVNGTLDGILFKRGNFSNVSIHVPGTIAPRVIIFAGVVHA